MISPKVSLISGEGYDLVKIQCRSDFTTRKSVKAAQYFKGGIFGLLGGRKHFLEYFFSEGMFGRCPQWEIYPGSYQHTTFVKQPSRSSC